MSKEITKQDIFTPEFRITLAMTAMDGVCKFCESVIEKGLVFSDDGVIAINTIKASLQATSIQLTQYDKQE